MDYTRIISNNQVIKSVHEILKPLGVKNNFSLLLLPTNFALVGGAVIDILEGRVPKDYDFIGHTPEIISLFILNGYEHQYSTKSADTYKKNGTIVQFVHTPLSSFDFKISQTRYDFFKELVLINVMDFTKKRLTPVSFDSKRNAMNSLRRIPHWQKKGYRINEKTYNSLLNIISESDRLIES